eukprot:g1874.t1
MSASLLHPDEMQRFRDYLGNMRSILAHAVVQLYKASPDPTKWTYTNLMGALLLTCDRKMGAFYFHLLDLESSVPKMLYQFELYEDLVDTYKELTPYFHSFEADDCVCGFNFASEAEAQRFRARVMVHCPTSAGKNNTPGHLRRNTNSQHVGSRSADLSSRGGSKKKGKWNFMNFFSTSSRRKADEMEISGVISVTHQSHIGFNADGTFELNNIPPEWKIIFKAAGVRKKDFKDKEKAAQIMQIIQEETSGVAATSAVFDQQDQSIFNEQDEDEDEEELAEDNEEVQEAVQIREKIVPTRVDDDTKNIPPPPLPTNDDAQPPPHSHSSSSLGESQLPGKKSKKVAPPLPSKKTKKKTAPPLPSKKGKKAAPPLPAKKKKKAPPMAPATAGKKTIKKKSNNGAKSQPNDLLNSIQNFKKGGLRKTTTQVKGGISKKGGSSSSGSSAAAQPNSLLAQIQGFKKNKLHHRSPTEILKDKKKRGAKLSSAGNGPAGRRNLSSSGAAGPGGKNGTVSLGKLSGKQQISLIDKLKSRMDQIRSQIEDDSDDDSDDDDCKTLNTNSIYKTNYLIKAYEQWVFKTNKQFPSPEKVRDEITQMLKSILTATILPALALNLSKTGQSKAFCGAKYGVGYDIASFFIVWATCDFYEFFYHYCGHKLEIGCIADEYVDQLMRSAPLLVIPLLVPINMDMLFAEFAVFFYGYGTYLHWGYELDWPDAHHPIINSAYQHYLHHAKSGKKTTFHCGFMFKIWDQLFGTMYKGKCGCIKCQPKRTREEFEKILKPDYSILFSPAFWLKSEVPKEDIIKLKAAKAQ